MSSGQPSVEYGQSCDENHVSRTSGSCSSSADPHVAHGVGILAGATVTWPSGQYHAGMRWPHQSCREMFQSRRLSSHADVRRAASAPART